MKYSDFLSQKHIMDKPSGFIPKVELCKELFPFQHDCTLWALQRGRAALFQDCGLGKTLQQLSWAKQVHIHTNKNVLIIAPLAVSKQTIREGVKFGYQVNLCSSQSDVVNGLNITNYEKLHKFDPDSFVGVVLDESSILKSYSGKYRNDLIKAFKATPYRLACTATPSPNDYMELGNHSEFLGIMTRSEMLSTFFINDSGDTGKWRLKRHAHSTFWKWACSWAVMIRKPSDLGYDDTGFILPPVHYHDHVVPSESKVGFLVQEAKGMNERRRARKNSIKQRCKLAADLVNKSDKTWLLWVGLNAEGDLLKSMIPGSIQVRGSDSDDFKTKSMLGFANGNVRILITKAKIGGFGMNWQICHNMTFVGLSDSFEAFYQASRRCWRFGQKEEVNIHIVTSEEEGSVVKNIKRKEINAIKMAKDMVNYMSNISSKNIKGTKREITTYNPQIDMELPEWLK